VFFKPHNFIHKEGIAVEMAFELNPDTAYSVTSFGNTFMLSCRCARCLKIEQKPFLSTWKPKKIGFFREKDF
jgi:hypothetical protein